MSLHEIRRGQQVRIRHIEGAHLRSQLIRFGITEGSMVRCLEKIPLGPLMLLLNRQEIAIGRAVAQRIQVDVEGSR
jgi:Fe2+ transport system protein FeoA